MSTINVRLTESLHRQVRELAQRDGVSMNRFITTALAEKLSALMTADYLEERAARASRERFEQALSRVRADAPLAGDALKE